MIVIVMGSPRMSCVFGMCEGTGGWVLGVLRGRQSRLGEGSNSYIRTMTFVTTEILCGLEKGGAEVPG